MFVKETCVAVWILNRKRNDLGELEFLADFMITCLSNCRIAICRGKACNQEQVD